MNSSIRRATIQDVADFQHIKSLLSFKNVAGRTVQGGFLLGSDGETYGKYIENEYCLVAENDGQLIGFGIILCDESLRAEDIWQRRHQANWYIDISNYENQSICYFEQLAFLPGHSRTVMRLCYQLANWAFQQHNFMFTTTVHAPILNLAAVPYLLKAGGEKIGRIDEKYAEIGQIISDIYVLSKVEYQAKIEEKHWKKFFNRNETAL